MGGDICRIGFCSNVVPLIRECLFSYLLDAIANKDMESSGIIIDVAQHHLTVSPESFLYLCVLHLLPQHATDLR